MAAAKDHTEGEQQLWRRYLRNRTKKDRNELVRRFVPLVNQHAGRMVRRLPPHISYDEIRCAAFDGLVQAIETFNPSSGATFPTYCRQRLFGAVVDWMRTIDTQGRAIRTFEKKRDHVAHLLRSAHERTPAPHEVADQMGMSVQKFNRMTRISTMGQAIPFSTLESSRNQQAGEQRTLSIPDPQAGDPSYKISRSMLASYLARGLSKNEKAILVLYYYENLTMSEIGSVLSLSESRVSQIHQDVLERLRKTGGNKLREELAG
jgi:RNA polymerase sigma factor for flagellar operon FliA